MKFKLKILRFNPETDRSGTFQRYEVEAEPADRILDTLMKIKRFTDGTLSFRKSCAHGVCGSDAVRIDGKNRLACKTLVKDVVKKDGDEVVVEPLRHMKVERDLIVDQTEFFGKYRSARPFLVNDDPAGGKERIQSQELRQVFDDATNCILCASCYSACPVFESLPEFIGPAAITQAFRFNADSRDKGFEDRLQALDAPDGVWPCANHFECTKACPREIKITKRINQTKKMISDHRSKQS